MLRTPMAVRSTVAIAAYLVVAGCSDGAVAPHAPGLPIALRSEEPGATVVPNLAKYRDRGARPATGRSGTVALTARALVDRSGTAELELTTGALDEAGSASLATGTLTKVQVKGIAPDGALLFIENYSGAAGGAGAAAATYNYDGLVRGSRLEVQAHVRAAGSNRVEVIALSETVRLRPDVAAGSLDAPRHAGIGTPVNIAATVREVNGEVGAHADCVLYVDGVAADHARGIWVDAGGVVSCAFTQNFTHPGVRRLEVRLESITPGDFDQANNRVAGEIEITTDPYGYSAWARDLNLQYSSSSSARTVRLSDGSISESGSNYGTTGFEQSSGITAEMRHQVTYPLARVDVSQVTGGATLHSDTYADVMPNSFATGNQALGQICYTVQYAPYGNARLYLCAFGTKTTLQYVRWAGDVTYHSDSYSLRWDAAGNPVGTPSYSWNDRPQVAGTRLPFGPDVTIRIGIEDDGAVYNTVAIVPLRPYEYRADTPLTCSDFTTSTRIIRSCHESHELNTGISGTVDVPIP